MRNGQADVQSRAVFCSSVFRRLGHWSPGPVNKDKEPLRCEPDHFLWAPWGLFGFISPVDGKENTPVKDQHAQV